MRRPQYDLPVSVECWRDWQTTLEQTLGASAPAELGSGRLSWPLLVWIPGDDWDPVERWVIYDMVPAQVLVEGAERRRRAGIPDHENQDQFWLDQLNGPHPRQRGRYDQVLKQFVPDERCLIDRYQWDLWQKYRAHGFVFWIVQGGNGGHLGHYSNEEQQLAKMDGLPSEPPDAGALPYAPFDQRVTKRLRLLRAVQQLRLDMALNGASWADAKRMAYRDALVAGKRTLLTGIDEYWRDAVRGMHLGSDAAVRRSDRAPDWVEQNEKLNERILTS